ncbi:MAG TPA: PAS domain-containing protein [Povalibacter sp.]|uniref:hybrid sensor histidine kinase/response regulator n=1 Tax=Povalibacter sp. TaxID=1962978 RepID=UPI002CF5354D|nr:PAS domain-containing protein [Povalibacter sp.]HMN45230.1 PAS domain-containing protein [Povalibacter sp.]
MGLDALAHGALLVDREGRILSANRAAQRVLAGSESRLDGHPVAEFIPDLNAAEIAAFFSGPQRARKRELLGMRRDGLRLPLRVGISRVRSGKAPVLLLTVGNLTRRKLLEATERDSRYSFRLLAQALPQILWTWTPAGEVEFIGPQWVEYTGQPAESQIGAGWLSQLHPDDRITVERARQEALSAAQTFKAEFRVRRHDGEYQWFEATIVPMRTRDGTFLRWIGIIANIHEARTNRLALMAERDRFARLIASVPGAVYAYRRGPDGAISFPLSTGGISNFVGVSPQMAQGRDPLTVPRIDEQDFARMQRSIDESARTLTPWHEEWRVHHPERGEVWVESRSMPYREDDGGTIWYGMMMDTTQRKRAEEELQRSQSRLQAAVMASGIGTYIWDVASGRLWWDDVLLRLFDRTREEIEAGGIEGAANFVQPEDRVLVTKAMVPLWQGRSDTLHVEYRSLRRDGALQWIGVSGRVDRDGNGKVIRLTGACTDITESKHAEEVRRNSQRIEALGTLAGGIAHDFNNLLLAIAGNTQLALSDLPPDHPAQRSLEEIERAAARASDLVHRILAFSHQSEPKRTVIELRPTIEEALRLLRATLPAIIGIRAEFDAHPLAVNADSTQIHQIIMNLVTNSAHAIGERGGDIRIAVAELPVAAGDLNVPAELVPGTYARISVHDTGHGMDQATLDRIFDPFFTTKPLGQGTGLGLSVVHGIVRAHDGAIAVASEPGHGATFDVYLPAAIRSEAPDDAALPATTQGRGQRVMYVDDEDALVFLVTRVLERLGYAVAGFVDASQALQAFTEHPDRYDVIVTDLSMPGMSGFTLARAILAVRPDIPVLMTSGYVRPQDREAAEQVGIRELILKPDTIDELGRSLERLFKLYRPAS